MITTGPFGTERGALRLANASPQRLVTAAWTAELYRAWRVADGVGAGTVWVNRYNRMFAETPSGGMSGSGIGRTRGLEGGHGLNALNHINGAVARARP